MLHWIKKHISIIITVLVSVGVLVFVYACEPKVKSLNDKRELVNRIELQVELDNILAVAKMRMASLDKQDALRNIILQNALVIVQGQPFNPVGLITGIAGIYGLLKVGSNVTKVVKTQVKKRTVNNART